MAAREIISHFSAAPNIFIPPRCHLAPSWCHYLYFCAIYIFAENNPAFSCHRFIIFKLQRILFLNCSEIASTFKFFDARNSSPSQSWLFFSFMRSWNTRQTMKENIETRKEQLQATGWDKLTFPVSDGLLPGRLVSVQGVVREGHDGGGGGDHQ